MTDRFTAQRVDQLAADWKQLHASLERLRRLILRTARRHGEKRSATLRALTGLAYEIQLVTGIETRLDQRLAAQLFSRLPRPLRGKIFERNVRLTVRPEADRIVSESFSDADRRLWLAAVRRQPRRPGIRILSKKRAPARRGVRDREKSA